MNRLYHLAWRAMGCEVSVQLETEDDGQRLLGELPAQVETIEARLSRFRRASELMRFNAQAGQWVEVSDVLFANIQAAKHAARLTDGDFNPLVLPALLANGYTVNFAELSDPATAAPIPAADWRGIELRPSTHQVRIPTSSAIDLGGIAKGWTVQHIANQLAEAGACLVNFGGDMVARGAPLDLPGWEVAIADPFGEAAIATLWLRDASLVTSGIDFRQWRAQDGTVRHHIIDPHTGQSADSDVMSVSIHHPDASIAEAYAKAVLLRGTSNGLYWLQSRWNAAGLVVRQDRAVIASPEFLWYMSERKTL